MGIARIINQLAREMGHGLLLKIASFAARAMLLVAVLPFMLPGELAAYMFATTIALLAARMLLLGIDLEIPLKIAGSLTEARKFASGLWVNWLLTIAAAALAFTAGGELWVTAFLTLTLASNLLLGGMVRTISPASFEQLTNIPMLIFAAAAISLQLEISNALLLTRAIAGLFVQTIIAARQQVIAKPSAEGCRFIAGELRQSLRAGWRKLLSNLSSRGLLRSFVLWPKAIQSVGLSDAIAFAVAIGEAVYQLGMVFANRRYAALANTVVVQRSELRLTFKLGASLTLVLSLIGCAGVFILTRFQWLPDDSNPYVLIQAMLFYAAMCIFSLAQFVAWTLRTHDWTAIISQLLLFLAIGVVILTFSETLWFALGTAGALLISGILMRAAYQKAA